LALGRQGITVDEALAVTGAACSLVYGFLASRLDLRPYAEMAGVAVFATVWGISGAAAGDPWRSVRLGLTPLPYPAWPPLARPRPGARLPALPVVRARRPSGPPRRDGCRGPRWPFALALDGPPRRHRRSLSRRAGTGPAPKPRLAWRGRGGAGRHRRDRPP